MQNQKPAIDFCEPVAGCDDGESGVEFVNPLRRSPRQIISCGRNREPTIAVLPDTPVRSLQVDVVSLDCGTAFTWLCLSGDSDILRPEDIRPNRDFGPWLPRR
jgi:hypothetical protein